MLGAQLTCDDYLQRLQQEIARLNQDDIRTMADWIYEAWEREQTAMLRSGTTP